MTTIEERLKDASPRLVILAACAFARTVEHLLTDHLSREGIAIAERFADGLATQEEVRAAAREAWGAAEAWDAVAGAKDRRGGPDPEEAAYRAARPKTSVSPWVEEG